ncbi:MAG TPA: hypothetical protein VK427_27640, partial [Kofleriaceae bacterium]|nr:hypothetical protein [Kofleriaceae bacterium]
RQYADLGGRVLGSHFHYTWTKNLIPQWQSTATWSDSGPMATPDLVDTSHPGGQSMAQWLLSVGASSVLGQVPLSQKIRNATAVAPTTTRWLYASGGTPTAPPTTHYLSFNTPVGVAPEAQCGKVVYAGMHVSNGTVNSSFPSGCMTAMSPDEKAFAFLIFDLTTCVGQIF